MEMQKSPEHNNSFIENCMKKTPLLLRLWSTINNTIGMAIVGIVSEWWCVNVWLVVFWLSIW
jgi:hypothetical protein